MVTVMSKPPKKILVADPDASLLKNVRELLVREGYEVTAVADARDVLRKVLADTPDALLLDFRLCRGSPFDVYPMLKSKKETGDIPVAFMTDPQSAASRQLDPGGALILLPKPFKPQQLLSVVGLLTSVRRKVAAS